MKVIAGKTSRDVATEEHGIKIGFEEVAQKKKKKKKKQRIVVLWNFRVDVWL